MQVHKSTPKAQRKGGLSMFLRGGLDRRTADDTAAAGAAPAHPPRAWAVAQAVPANAPSDRSSSARIGLAASSMPQLEAADADSQSHLDGALYAQFSQLSSRVRTDVPMLHNFSACPRTAIDPCVLAPSVVLIFAYTAGLLPVMRPALARSSARLATASPGEAAQTVRFVAAPTEPLPISSGRRMSLADFVSGSARSVPIPGTAAAPPAPAWGSGTTGASPPSGAAPSLRHIQVHLQPSNALASQSGKAWCNLLPLRCGALSASRATQRSQLAVQDGYPTSIL